MGSLCGSFIHFISNTVFNITPLVTVLKHFETRDFLLVRTLIWTVSHCWCQRSYIDVSKYLYIDWPQY